MSTAETNQLHKILKLIASDNKFKIILHLKQGEECVCDIAEKLEIEQSLVSHHLNSLREAGLVNDRKISTWVHCSLNKQAFKHLSKLFTKHFDPENISDKMCSIHEPCKFLAEGGINEE